MTINGLPLRVHLVIIAACLVCGTVITGIAILVSRFFYGWLYGLVFAGVLGSLSVIVGLVLDRLVSRRFDK